MSEQKIVSVDNLRNAGCRVRVSHVRRFKTWFLDSAGNSDTLGTRREFELYSESMSQNLQGKYCENVLPTGGFTLVEVTLPNGQTLTSKHNFRENEAYWKRHGVRIALNKLVGRNEELFFELFSN